MVFCLTIQPILQSLSSELVVAFMDDVTLGGSESVTSRLYPTSVQVMACSFIHPNAKLYRTQELFLMICWPALSRKLLNLQRFLVLHSALTPQWQTVY